MHALFSYSCPVKSNLWKRQDNSVCTKNHHPTGTVKNKHNDFGSVFLNFPPLFTITQSGDIIDKQISGLWYFYENLL